MGLLKLFDMERAKKKAMGFIGGFAGNVRDGLNRVGRLVKPGVAIAGKIANGMALLPGTIGTVAKVASAGINNVKQFIDKIPNESIKNTLNSYVSKGEEHLNKGLGTANNYVRDVNDSINTNVKPWLKFANDNLG